MLENDRVMRFQDSGIPVAHRYAELHCHSAFSLLDGASNPEDLVIRAREVGLAALALTDHDDLGGIVRVAYAAKELALDAITGCELTLEDDSHLTLLVENLTGYKNLCYLVSQGRSASDRGKPCVSYELLAERADGMIALSGCPHGQIASCLAVEAYDKAERLARRLADVFKDRFYLEVWHHYQNQESLIAKRLLSLSSSLSIPWVVTNNVHYATADKRIIHDVLTCLRHDVTLSTAGRRLRPNGSFYMKSPEEMISLWKDNLEGINNTLAIAERCQFRLSS
ncbi:MAG TPA: PHP domain-containing protein, partial [Candidatus Obscuribacterales bacterium]